MPLYDFICDQCQQVFEVRATIKEKADGLEPECPVCHSKQVHQIISAGFMLRGGGNQTSAFSSCGPSLGSGCCG